MPFFIIMRVSKISVNIFARRDLRMVWLMYIIPLGVTSVLSDINLEWQRGGGEGDAYY